MATADTISYQQTLAMQPAPTAQPAPYSSSGSSSAGYAAQGSTAYSWYIWLQSNPIFAPDNTIETRSPPPDGLNTNPKDCFGVSSDPAVAEQQLLDLMEWTREGGFDKRNCAIIWVCAMIGFNIRLNQWNAEGLSNDPSVMTINSTLWSLTQVESSSGQSLSDMVVQNLAAMVLYGAYDQNGGNLTEASNTVMAALNSVNDVYLEAFNAGKISNPMLTSFDDSVQYLLDPTNFNTWESQYIDTDGTLINGDLDSFSDQCIYLSEGVNSWCMNPSTESSHNLAYVEGQSRSAWAGNLINAGYAIIYVICLILIAVMDQYNIDAGSVQAEMDLYSGVTDSYSTMQMDASNPELTEDQFNEMMESAQQVQMACELDPRMSNSQSAGTAADEILQFNDPTSDVVQEYATPGASDPCYSAWMNCYYVPNTTTDPYGSQQALRVQEMTSNLQNGMTSLTSYANTLPTILQTYTQMILQVGNTMSYCTTHMGNTIDYIVSKSNGNS